MTSSTATVISDATRDAIAKIVRAEARFESAKNISDEIARLCTKCKDNGLVMTNDEEAVLLNIYHQQKREYERAKPAASSQVAPTNGNGKNGNGHVRPEVLDGPFALLEEHASGLAKTAKAVQAVIDENRQLKAAVTHFESRALTVNEQVRRLVDLERLVSEERDGLKTRCETLESAAATHIKEAAAFTGERAELTKQRDEATTRIGELEKKLQDDSIAAEAVIADLRTQLLRKGEKVESAQAEAAANLARAEQAEAEVKRIRDAVLNTASTPN